MLGGFFDDNAHKPVRQIKVNATEIVNSLDKRRPDVWLQALISV
jgi:hypothetical protein